MIPVVIAVADKPPKSYKFIGFGAMDATKPCKFIGFGAMDVTKPYKFIGFGAMDVTKPYRFIGFGAMDANRELTAVRLRRRRRAGRPIGPRTAGPSWGRPRQSCGRPG